MIYETAFVLKPSSTEDVATKVTGLVTAAVTEAGGEVLITEDWGLRNFAQATSKGETKGKFYYVMYSSDGKSNLEIERRMKLSEETLKWIVVKLGDDKNKDNIVKNHKNPNNEVVEKDAGKAEKDKRNSAKSRSCYFSATKSRPDWKDPMSYKWLVNEFGKINPGRVTGLRPRYQKLATTVIKQARTMGFISHLSNRVSERVQ